jgi:hypothetical protein
LEKLSPVIKDGVKQLKLQKILWRDKGPIISPEHTNVATKGIKDLIVENLQCTGSKEIHLFFGPAPQAMFLGHRLDATAPVICYGWIGNEQYTRSCRLFSGPN